MTKQALIAAMLAGCMLGTAPADDLAWLNAHNVVWTSRSKNSGESMPVGGGGIGPNVWGEVHRPVAHVDGEAARPLTAAATFGTWRTRGIFLGQGRNKHRQAGMAMMSRDGFPGKVWLYQDPIAPGPRSVTWFHRMRNDKGVFDYSVRQQRPEAVRDDLYDPLTDLTFGRLLADDAAWAAEPGVDGADGLERKRHMLLEKLPR